VNNPSFVLLAIALVGCGAASSQPPEASAASAAGATSTAAAAPASGASYEVPVPADLASAATYNVTEVDWSVSPSGIAHLSYPLPLGLVGQALEVDLSGPFDAATQTGILTGAAGSATCTLSGSSLTCNETLSGFLPLTPNLAVVQAVAAQDFAGPAQQRVDVAIRFSADPLGILHADLASNAASAEDGSGKSGKSR
jgi:hypothetical protein